MHDACHHPQVVNLQAELTNLHARLSTMELPTPSPFAAHTQMPMTASFCVSNLPTSSNVLATVDLSTTFFEPQTQSHSQWAFQQQHVEQEQLHQQQYVTVGEGPGSGGVSGSRTPAGGDLQLLAGELLDRHGTAAVGSEPEPTPSTK